MHCPTYRDAHPAGLTAEFPKQLIQKSRSGLNQEPGMEKAFIACGRRRLG